MCRQFVFQNCAAIRRLVSAAAFAFIFLSRLDLRGDAIDRETFGRANDKACTSGNEISPYTCSLTTVSNVNSGSNIEGTFGAYLFAFTSSFIFTDEF